jgi:hypothetical protein
MGKKKSVSFELEEESWAKANEIASKQGLSLPMFSKRLVFLEINKDSE